MDPKKKRQRSDNNVNGESSSQNKKFKGQNESENVKQELEQDKLTSIDNFFYKLKFFILKAGIEKARFEIFKKQVRRFGGTVVDSYNNENVSCVSYIIVDDKMDETRLLRLLDLQKFPSTTVLKSAWLSLCLKHKKLVELGELELKPTEDDSRVSQRHEKSELHDNANELPLPGPSQVIISRKEPMKGKFISTGCENSSGNKAFIYHSDSDYAPSDDEDSRLDISSHSMSNPQRKSVNEMVKAYESTNDKWRAFGYQKAIQALRRHPKEISSWEEAKSLPSVGGKLADKIWEIAQSGELRKLTEFKSNEEINILQMFHNVWGAGPHTAQLWYQQGFRSIQDLQNKAHLNHQQKVGVRLFDDLIERMPREEAAEIEQFVRETAESLVPGIVAQACGSYRRGKATCGDVDVLVTHPDGRSHKGIFSKLLSKLKESGFLTDDLVTAEDSGNQKKYLGVCKLPGENTKHRRLDIIVVPYDEYGCALVYFTGSAHFNRSLRHLCKKHNMSLNEHALKIGVVRKGTEKIHEGAVVSTPKEEDVFKALKVPFRPPEERDH